MSPEYIERGKGPRLGRGALKKERRRKLQQMMTSQDSDKINHLLDNCRAAVNEFF